MARIFRDFDEKGQTALSNSVTGQSFSVVLLQGLNYWIENP